MKRDRVAPLARIAGFLGIPILLMLVMASCSTDRITSGDSADPRLYFLNGGSCTLAFQFSGGVAAGAAGIDHIPAVGVRNDVPISGPGSISVRFLDVPPGVESCTFEIAVSDGARFELRYLDMDPRCRLGWNYGNPQGEQEDVVIDVRTASQPCKAESNDDDVPPQPSNS